MEPVLKASVSERAALVDLAKAVVAGKTFRLPLEWPKALGGEQPLEVAAADLEEPLRLLVKRAGGRVTPAGRLLRGRPVDDAQGERLERLAAADEPVSPDTPPAEPPAETDGAVAAKTAPSPAWAEVRTGDTLPPPSMVNRGAERAGDTLKPGPLSAPAVEQEKAEPEDGIEDAHDPQDDSEPDRESAPEIEFRHASSIPPELVFQPDEDGDDEDEIEVDDEDELEDEIEVDDDEDDDDEDDDDEDEGELELDDENDDDESAPEPSRAAEPPTPSTLEAAAHTLLARDSTADEQALLDAGELGARALCQIRVGATVDAVGRSRFLGCLRELGPAARPAIAEALGAALAHATRAGEPAALEDLLRAAPEAEDDDLARTILPMCTHASAPVRQAALAALPKVYGERAKPLLRDALRDDDEAVCRTAIEGLRRVGGIDVLVLHRLEPLLTGDEDASDELRALAAAALTDVDAGQRNAALDALKRTLNPRTSMVSLFIKSEEANPMLVEAVCRTMLSIGGPKERRLVSKHAARSRPPLRQRLEALLDQLS